MSMVNALTTFRIVAINIGYPGVIPLDAASGITPGYPRLCCNGKHIKRVHVLNPKQAFVRNNSCNGALPFHTV